MPAAVQIDNAKLKQIMPGLRRLALFPGKTVEICSFETGVELQDLQDWIDASGRPTAAKIEDLEDVLAGVDSEPEVVAAPAIKFHGPNTDAVGASAPKVDTKPKDETMSVNFKAVAEILCKDPTSVEAQACKKAGVLTGSWSYFKKAKLGTAVGLDRQKLADHFGLVLVAAAPASKAPVPKADLDVLAKTAFKVNPKRNARPKTANFRTKKGLKDFLSAAQSVAVAAVSDRLGCSVCGGFTVHVRGRRPGDPIRDVCPECQANRLADIRELADPCPQVAITASPDA